jgi:uncharacterized protein YndB with AHSA1/START domain
MTGDSQELTLRIKRQIPIAVSLVFRAFVDADQVDRWWGPKGFTVTSLNFDPRPGSSYRIQMQPPEGDAFFLTGEFREVEPPARLVLTFRWEDPDPDDVETLVQLAFANLDEATEITLIQSPFKTEARRNLHRQGWNDSFDKVERLLSHPHSG